MAARLILTALAAFLAAGPADGALYAAAGKADITPDLRREKTWLAGYGPTGRKPEGVHDPLYARALLLSDGKKTVAMVSLDLIGLFREDVEAMRAALGWDGEERYLFVSATHQHSGPDTLGLWGRFPGVSGVDPRYRKRVHEAVARLLKDISRRLVEAELYAARAEVDPRGRCRDLRDPVVIDPELNVLQLRPKGRRGPPIGTLVRWSCHPEALGAANRLITADYPGALCARLEKETGGACVFKSGVVGGLLAPDTDPAPERQFAEMERLGGELAAEALQALRGAERIGAPSVAFARRLVRLPVENSRYLLFLPNLTFGHKLYAADGRELPRRRAYWLALRHLLFFPLPERLRPWIETELSLVALGPVKILGIPGELFPELAIGGYDGRYRFGRPLTSPANPNPPRLEAAPKPPYLRELLGARHGLIVGLANDMLGYIVPEYDFQVTPTRSMDPRPPGTHYEETNSLGREASRLLVSACEEFLRRR